MKIAPQRVEMFLRKPLNCRVILLFGENIGMIRHRADGLVRTVAGSLDDPFLVTDMPGDKIATLQNEASLVSLTGGRRVVRVRDVTDTALSSVQAVLSGGGDALVVLEGAPGLPARSKLRVLLDAASDGAAIACHPEEGRALEDTIRHLLSTTLVTIDDDALAWLGTQVGADQLSTSAELEKVALYAGPYGRVDLDKAMYCVGDVAGLSLDDALFAATVGDVSMADRALELAMAEGITPVGILRGGQMHLQRLYRARLLVETGTTASDAAKYVRPPIFYRRIGTFTKALGLWSSMSLAAAMAALGEAERNCKRTSAPDHTLSRHVLLTLARRAATAR